MHIRTIKGIMDKTINKIKFLPLQRLYSWVRETIKNEANMHIIKTKKNKA